MALWIKIFAGLRREEFWMKTLQKNFPYGLNEIPKDITPEATIGTNIYPIGRFGESHKILSS